MPLIITCAMPLLATGQTLKVIPSPDKGKFNRSVPEGCASVVFDSRVKGLTVYNDAGDFNYENPEGFFVYIVDVAADRANNLESSNRQFLINSPRTPEYLLTLKDILPAQFYYYTIILPDLFPFNISAEYLFSRTSKHGFRISAGRRFGGYIAYKWGDYKKTGTNINKTTTFQNVSNASKLGYIRNAITAGLRAGLYNRPNSWSLYALIGGGYGDYGRQWQNQFYKVDNSIYFHSDYIRGFDGEVALQGVIKNWIVLSAGAEIVTDGKHSSFDYQIGVGVNLNLTKFRKKKANTHEQN